MLSFFFRSTSTNAYDSFVKGASLTALLLTTSYSDCFDFTLSKVGDGYIDGAAFLFKILMNLTLLVTPTSGGIRKSAWVKWSGQMWKVLKWLIFCLVLAKKLNPFSCLSGSFSASWRQMLSALGFDQKSKTQLPSGLLFFFCTG